MKVVFIAPHDTSGGAVRIARYLFDGLLDREFESFFISGKKTTNHPNIYELNHGDSLLKKIILKSIKKINYKIGLENFYYPKTKDLLNLIDVKPDIIHIHNPQGGYFDLRQLEYLSNSFPTILTLHDQWLFTGHCSYAINCDRWEFGCGKCPDLSLRPGLGRDGTHWNWKRKKKIYSKSKLFITTPSNWLMSDCEKSTLFNSIRMKRVINNGVDLKYFNSFVKSDVRRKLNIGKNAFVLLYVVSNNFKKNKYKDYMTIDLCLKRLSKMLPKNIETVFLGLGCDDVEQKYGRITKKFIPYQKKLDDIASYYKAADIYIHAANGENFPNVILEAMACGTPVVATEVGGVPEQIIHGETGWLVPYRDYKSMSDKILDLSKNMDSIKRCGDRASKIVEDKYSSKTMINNYIKFYDDVVNDFKSL